MGPRPTGVTVIAIVIALLGVYLLMLGSVFIGAVFASLITFGTRGPVEYGHGIVSLGLGVVLLIVAAGLWGMVRWAWTVAVGALVIVILDVIVGFVVSGSPLPLVGLVLAVIALVYLARPEVRGLFGSE